MPEAFLLNRSQEEFGSFRGMPRTARNSCVTDQSRMFYHANAPMECGSCLLWIGRRRRKKNTPFVQRLAGGESPYLPWLRDYYRLHRLHTLAPILPIPIRASSLRQEFHGSTTETEYLYVKGKHCSIHGITARDHGKVLGIFWWWEGDLASR